jgi:hypothetical protein
MSQEKTEDYFDEVCAELSAPAGSSASGPDDKSGSASKGGAPGQRPVRLPDPFEPLWKRGISREVAEGRGYVSYYGRQHPLHDPDRVRAELARYELTPGQQVTLMRFMNSARDELGRDGFGDGLIMHKHPVPGAPPIAPQLRPREAVRTGGQTRHRHDRAFGDRADELARHLAKEHQGEEDVAPDEFHTHEDDGKYLLCPKAKRDFWHDHETDLAFEGPHGQAKLRAHLRADHRGKNVAGEHKHRRDASGQNVANRIDAHPWALDRLPTAERIYFALEGTPKADAILTRIIATGEPASVFNVPSVTLWKAPELKRFAKQSLVGSPLSQPLVVIVVDADHHENPRVVRQALLLRERLDRYGVRACIAAPPDDRDAGGELLYKGVDDFLAKGGDLDELRVMDRKADFSLALHASEDGTIRRSAVGLAPILLDGVRKDPERVRDVLQAYANAGLISIEGSLDLELDDWSGGLVWRERPTFIVRPDRRYKQRILRLGDYWSAGWRIVDIVWSEAQRAAAGESIGAEHWAEGIDKAAKWFGLASKTVRDDELVQRLRRGYRDARDRAIRSSDRHGLPIERFGLSDRQARRILKGDG